MPNTHPAIQTFDGVFVEDITNHPVGLALIEATSGATGDYTTGILASMLQQR